jgi:PAS domain S-box-containing protein
MSFSPNAFGQFSRPIDSPPCGVAIVSLSHRMLWVNPELARLLKFEPHEMIGRTFEEITHPEDVALDSHLAERLMKGELDRYEFIKRFVDKSGAVVVLHLYASLISDPANRPLYALALVTPASLTHGLGTQHDVRRSPLVDDVERIRNAILK